MVWATLATQVTLTPAPAAWANQVKQNFDASPNAVVTTAGDLAVATGAGAFARLAAVAVGSVLVSNGVGVAPAWAAAPFPAFVGARVYDVSNQSIASGGGGTVLTFAGERFKTVAALHSTSSNTSRLVADRTGYWLAVGDVMWPAGATGVRTVGLMVNGGSTYGRVSAPGNALAQVQTLSAVLNLTANDYVELWVFQDSGGALSVQAIGPYSPEFSLHFLGA